MKTKILFAIAVASVSILLFACAGSKPLTYNVSSETQCAKKDGYWYKGKCWKDFEEEGIAVSDIDSVVDEQMALYERFRVDIDGKTYPLIQFLPVPQGEKLILITTYQDEAEVVSIYQEVPQKALKKKGTVASDAALIQGNIMEDTDEDLSEEEIKRRVIGKGTFKVEMRGDMEQVKVSGTYTEIKTNTVKKISYAATEDFGASGTSTMVVKGDEVHINGDLGTRSYFQLKNVLQEHPNVKTAVLGNISGSVNDAVNMHTGRLLREAGLNTKVLADSKIASGGVDLFCAGVERIIEKGAELGIHSWCCTNDLTAAEIPKDHPAHQYQIEYFTLCLGEENGPDFYFYTLEAAPFDDVHWMSEDEMKKWNVTTSIID